MENNGGEEGEEGHWGEGGANRGYDSTEDCDDGIKFQ